MEIILYIIFHNDIITKKYNGFARTGEKMTKKKIIIIVSIIALILAMVSIVTTFLIKNNKPKEDVNKINVEELENNFNNIFTNAIYPEIEENKEKVYLAYDIETEETGKFSIDTNIPNINIDTQIVKNINNDIFNSFAKNIIKVMEQTGAYTIYNIDYVSYINNNILSLVIKCTLKEGSNPQRVIIKTYNYDMEKDKLLTLQEIINLKGLDGNETQNKILEKIQKEIDKFSEIANSGYNIYKRDINDLIYKIPNTTNFFLGNENVLYIVYSYGNNSYTSEVDLIICQ